MFNQPIRNIQDFLLSTYFADGLRITIGVLCPSLILAQFGMLQYGMTLSLGALCISVVDSPGPNVHRRNYSWFNQQKLDCYWNTVSDM